MYSEIVRKIEKIVGTHSYGMVGVTKKRLYYVSNVDGTYDLWVAGLDGSNRTKIAERPLTGSRVRKDKEKIYFAKDVSQGRELAKIYAWEEGKTKELEMDPMRILSIAYFENILSFAGSTSKENLICIAYNDREIQKVYSSNKWIFVNDIYKDYMVASGTLAGNPKSMEILIYNLKANEYRIFTPKEGSYNVASAVRENKILMESNFKGKKKLYVYDIEANLLSEPELDGEDYKNYEFQDYLSFGFTDDGEIWFIGLHDYRAYAFLDGYKIPHPEGTPSYLDFIDDEIYFNFSSLKTPYSIFKAKLKGGWEKILGDELDEEIKDQLGDVSIVKYKSFDNLEIPSTVYRTKNPSKIAIIYVHGGPWSHVGDFWNASITALVSAGFNVIAPNYRGSTGYGEEFRTLDIGDPGGGDLKDIVYARNYAIENKIGEKIAIMGYSYGGFMSYLVTVKEPELWHAAVAGAGVVDWEMMYELADATFKHFQDLLFAGKNDLKRDRSAINFAEKLKVPICIIHPQNDSRTPLKPVLKYIEKLLENGKTFEAHIIPNMGHVVTSIEDAYKLLLPAITFLQKHLI